MLFSSNIFLLLFFPITVIVNSLIKPKYSNYFLLAASLLFYAWGEPVYVLLMLFSILINWGFGLIINKYPLHRQLSLVLCIAINLLLLAYYKYYNFFISSINHIAGSQVFSIKEIVLPIGISFFTFQSLSYVVDLYRGSCPVQKNIINLALYISLFPQLIAGPIVRYSDIDRQIVCRTTGTEKFSIGFRRFIFGLGKKVIISNAMAEIADMIFDLPADNLTTVTAWLGAIAYTMQIYYDFSGYSDMAIGLGRILGFDFLENFNYPYLSRSIHEFWQRWHISLGTWFREYVYIPLGGNRKGNVRTYINLIVVFFLTGMWHGASWNFVIWGLYHGFFQIIERIGFKRFLSNHPVFSRIYCITVVVFGWVLFRCSSLLAGIRYILRMVCPWKYGFSNMFQVVVDLPLRNTILLMASIVGCGILQRLSAKFPKLEHKWRYQEIEAGYLCVVLFYCLILLAAGSYNPFIYFRF